MDGSAATVGSIAASCRQRRDTSIHPNPMKKSIPPPPPQQHHPHHNNNSPSKILLLHGNRQTGELLLGRVERFRKKLYKALNIEIVAIDAPFEHPLDNGTTRTWWHRSTSDDSQPNEYVGLDVSIDLVQSTWRSASSTSDTTGHDAVIPFVGLIGFSQGARLVHLLSLRHEYQKQQAAVGHSPPLLNGLQFVMMVSGYDAPLPNTLYSLLDSHDSRVTSKCTLPSLHVWGDRDQLVLPQLSSDVAKLHYHEPTIHTHDGGHHVPMRAADVHVYLDFIHKNYIAPSTNDVTNSVLFVQLDVERNSVPDDDCAMQQHDEVSALEAIYGNEFHLLSNYVVGNEDEATSYEYPITFRVDLYPTDDDMAGTSWPRSKISIHVVFPPLYPNIAPILSVIQDDGFPLSSHLEQASECIDAICEAASNEVGMPCIMSCLLAAKDYFDAPPSTVDVPDQPVGTINISNDNESEELDRIVNESDDRIHEYDDSTIKKSSTDRIRLCNLQGLEIAATFIKHAAIANNCASDSSKLLDTSTGTPYLTGKGGSWMFTIGLVGKPSAGKSTFFNTATGFARQRQTAESGEHKNNVYASGQLGGAAMAPHPFTTINPNVGYCLVPAPPESCPEDSVAADQSKDAVIGSTHGRDCNGRRFLPVVLKDVAGLVPGAYQGRGRGNQFLNDLCDADVLIHVCDASGMADSEGNMIASSEQIETISVGNIADEDGGSSALIGGSDPLHDMAWIRNELIEWVYTNLIRKWDTIRRKGRSKLEGMFSGYGQTMAMTCNLLNAVEKYMIQLEEDHEQQKFVHPYEQMEEWDTGDIYRLVSAFLGVRFPIALALNKVDLPSSKVHIDQIIKALPVHGTHVAIPLSAKREMQFTKRHIEASLAGKILEVNDHSNASIPLGTWNCLQSAICLCDPILVFPVVDHQSYLPLPGLFRYATSDPSLPSPGMIACIHAAGGMIPSEWDSSIHQYSVPKMNGNKKKAVTQSNVQLRDAIMMKPGSTINDLFNTLKKMGALSGEFIRAEAASHIHVLPKPVTKYQTLSHQIRIIKIMTNKRSAWQSAM